MSNNLLVMKIQIPWHHYCSNRIIQGHFLLILSITLVLWIFLCKQDNPIPIKFGNGVKCFSLFFQLVKTWYSNMHIGRIVKHICCLLHNARESCVAPDIPGPPIQTPRTTSSPITWGHTASRRRRSAWLFGFSKTHPSLSAFSVSFPGFQGAWSWPLPPPAYAGTSSRPALRTTV